MRAAGVVEFALAFALIWTPLVRRIAAIILAGDVHQRDFEFGKIDAIGHALIIVVLLAIIADTSGGRRWSSRARIRCWPRRPSRPRSGRCSSRVYYAVARADLRHDNHLTVPAVDAYDPERCSVDATTSFIFG